MNEKRLITIQKEKALIYMLKELKKIRRTNVSQQTKDNINAEIETNIKPKLRKMSLMNAMHNKTPYAKVEKGEPLLYPKNFKDKEFRRKIIGENALIANEEILLWLAGV